MGARELKDDELVDVTGGNSLAERMCRSKYYEVFKSLPCGFTMDNVDNAYKTVSNMYKEDCMGSDLTPEERDNLFSFIQNLNRIYQGKSETTFRREPETLEELQLLGRACVVVKS